MLPSTDGVLIVWIDEVCLVGSRSCSSCFPVKHPLLKLIGFQNGRSPDSKNRNIFGSKSVTHVILVAKHTFLGLLNSMLQPTNGFKGSHIGFQQESPAVADKPARLESMPKIAPIRRAYNVVDDNTGLSSFV